MDDTTRQRQERSIWDKLASGYDDRTLKRYEKAYDLSIRKTQAVLSPEHRYSSADIMGDKPHVAAFINFYLRRVKHYITDVGYFLPDEEAFRETINRFPE
jgi:hypothetical protein